MSDKETDRDYRTRLAWYSSLEDFLRMDYMRGLYEVCERRKRRADLCYSIVSAASFIFSYGGHIDTGGDFDTDIDIDIDCEGRQMRCTVHMR